MADLILGASGMVGRALSRHLSEATKVSHWDFSLTNEIQTSQYFLYQDRLETVYFAAGRVGGIEDNQAHPVAYLADNITMGLTALKFAHKSGAKQFINISSSCAFPPLKTYLCANDLWSGRPAETNAAYGIAKRVIAEACHAYRKEHNFNAKTVYLPNLYGDVNQGKVVNKLHVIPAIIQKVRKAQETGEKMVKLRGNGDARREFMHVDDAAQAVIEVSLNPFYSAKETILVGSGEILSVKELASAIREAMNWDGLFEYDRSDDGQDFRAMKADFVVEPQKPLKERIKEMVTDFAPQAA